MKRRPITPSLDSEHAERSLCEALLALRSVEEMRAFLDDLCTPAEREAMRDRWCVVPHLIAGEPYREIHENTAVSVTTIGRVARCLDQGAGGYRLAAKRLKLDRPAPRAAEASARSPA
ncbi:MAG TPA: YerC/YecD family TrpR-related protein [Dokdonella sp.]|uniref:YerC/YecD family TrpR-related protein n=1 Tax=Dokdonella sp. TaxID=2291710 RepID=UPI002C1FC011|nr:YerC/YecD family TrpR-related protein [Dokdonella sp.]HUD41320.1 YerC/YecD family TrpR-related protein [Dokdonella sp.]